MSKPSNMSTTEARSIISEVYGARGQTQFAADIQRGEVTVSRWLTGKVMIATTEALLMRLILVMHRKGLNWRKWIDDYEREQAGTKNLEDLL